MAQRSMRLLLWLAAAVAAGCGQPYDVVLAGGEVHDGLGGAPQRADVGIRGDRVAAIGDLSGARAETRVDVSGLAVVPGFVDLHSHAVRGVLRHPLAENYLRQGVTTAMGGPDGGSPLPIGEWLTEFEAEGSAINMGLMVGHGTVRRDVMGLEDRAPTEAELDAMRALVDQAMREGAYGLSTGLKYAPGSFAETEEVIELAKVAGGYGGIHVSHMREEGLTLLDSVRETIRIGEEGGLPTQLTHHKVVGAPMWGKSTESLHLVDEAVARGVDVTIDQYPYTASSTGLTILFPGWSLAGGNEALLERLRDPEQRERIRQAVKTNLEVDRGGGSPDNVQISRCAWDPSLEGKTMGDVLRERGLEVNTDNGATLALELQEKGGFGGVFHAMHEDDVRRIMAHPLTMISSDGGVVAPGEGVPHPRNYGTFSRVLSLYVREAGLLSFEEAIRKMASFPAERLSLDGRGVIGEGAIADIAVLDPATVEEHGEFGDPHHYSTGVRHVLVSGVFVLQDGEVTGARPGKALRLNAP
ncbi:MAG: D-aminoacylase [Acidobacteria bacterium]|nr:D-aminoacylase [Acidobacteriota bacterium]MYA45034.1 D-aminoacylase [Acidobacteriota bacterium]MYI39827.1 D-aminoacylase [Acidobacteriota bacterium]